MKRGGQMVVLWAALAGGFCLMAVLLFAGDVGVCRYIAGSQDISFAGVNIGDSREAVLARVGPPSSVEREDPGRHFLPVCKNACVEKYVYTYYVCLDLKARRQSRRGRP